MQVATQAACQVGSGRKRWRNSRFVSILKDTRRQAEQQRLREVLESVGGDQRQACEILGVSRATLWRRMKKHC